MHWRWLFNGFADPDLSLTPEQRKNALRVSTHALRLRMTIVTILFLIPPAIAVIWAIDAVGTTVASYINLTQQTTHWLLLGVFLVFFWIWSAFIYGHTYARPYRRALRDIGIRLCINCGYSMESLEPHTRCPECGWNQPAGPAPGAEPRTTLE